MNNFLEWIKLKESNMYFGQPHGPMGPDGRIYGHASGPIGKLAGTNTWATVQTALAKSKEHEGLWTANGPVVRLGYLSAIPNAENLGFHNMSWGELPKEIQNAVIRSMDSKSPFGD